ncbi:type VI secretion system tip protein VgrG [Roseomonas sp. OT10]|uniref:type VI secretion system Vgr family protein n=1 Tax=Roseomonas cutis TaxID=2897332 RepID=UPI001E43D04D|nr:type VI secretion system tip protein TssI/VgrG [Roseomonas sp. OT10]UFN47776.1 type VI secretion system tip protein VgrG [Roseomonas sp. OT10]
MSGGYAQSDRLLRITTPLGADVLILRRLEVVEAIGRPFAIEAEVFSSRDDLRPADLIGKPVTCILAVPNQPERYFHGIVSRFARAGDYGRGLTRYRLDATPRLWQLTRTTDCRIFQGKSVQAIAQAILQEGNVAPVRFGTLPSGARNYVVQWNETDLDFIQRLLDEVGGGYFFRHDEGDHTLYVTGANADFPAIPGDPVTVRAEAAGPDSLWEWHPSTRQRPAKTVARDYDGLRPAALLNKTASTVMDTSSGDWEVYHWPGGQAVRPDADPAKLEIETEEALAEAVQANGRNPAVFAGGRLLVRAALEGETKPWLVTEARHSAVDETHMAGGGDAVYRNALTLIPADRPWRNPNPRPRPVMPGLQSAIVTGPEGEEIYCDEYGRVKIHFLWDRKGSRRETSSCWARVAQGAAGAWGGTWFLPRIGDEVLVGFMDGDPDRPVVLGSLYNNDAKQTYALPDNMTRSWVVTRSSKQGSAENANILRFEDKKGSEEVYLHAEKDMNTVVEDNRDAKIQKGNDTTTVQSGNRTVTVEKGDLTTKVTTGKETHTVKADRAVTIEQGNETHTVQQGNRETEISMGNEKLVVKMGNRETEISMGNEKLEVKLGNIDIKAALGKIDIEAMQSITLKVGGSSIVIDQIGVTIKGTVKVEVKGVMVQQSADALMVIKGGLVMIN